MCMYVPSTGDRRRPAMPRRPPSLPLPRPHSVPRRRALHGHGTAPSRRPRARRKVRASARVLVRIGRVGPLGLGPAVGGIGAGGGRGGAARGGRGRARREAFGGGDTGAVDGGVIGARALEGHERAAGGLIAGEGDVELGLVGQAEGLANGPGRREGEVAVGWGEVEIRKWLLLER